MNKRNVVNGEQGTTLESFVERNAEKLCISKALLLDALKDFNLSPKVVFNGVAVYSDSSLKLAVDEIVERRVSFNMFISLAKQFNEAVEKISEKTGIELRKFDLMRHVIKHNNKEN